MPIYDYLCDRGHVHEQRRSLTDTETSCQTCGGPARRQFANSFTLIMRPEGYRLRPRDPKDPENTGDPGYWKFTDREKETRSGWLKR